MTDVDTARAQLLEDDLKYLGHIFGAYSHRAHDEGHPERGRWFHAVACELLDELDERRRQFAAIASQLEDDGEGRYVTDVRDGLDEANEDGWDAAEGWNRVSPDDLMPGG